MNNDEITLYFGEAIENLIKSILKHTVGDPKGSAFLIRYISSSRKAHKKRSYYESKGTHIPVFLISSITQDCNLNCIGCYAKAGGICGRSAEGTMLTDERWAQIFSNAEDIGVSFILIAGGEPLLRKSILMQAAKIKDIIFPVFTNGMLLDKEYVKLFAKNRNLIPVISIEGGLETTDARRGAGSYLRILEVMKELMMSGLLFGASVTVTAGNLEETASDEFLQLMHDCGCRIVFFNEYVPVEENTESLALTNIGRVLLEDRLDILRKERDDMIIMSFPGDEKITGGCLAAGKGFFHISPGGNAEPCPFSPFSDRNLKESSLMDALDSPLFRKLKEMDPDCDNRAGGCALFENKDIVKQLIDQ
jgi:MoaA/NifB/PqqE/SkfB family radical SAM enzyme